MTFMQPLGLLVLIGIPIVILIYILRSKYNEQTVTSTYIWELSEKFLKRKNPLSGLTGLDQSIDYKVAVALPQFTLHAKIGGTFTSPKVSLDAAKSAEALLDKAGVDKQEVQQQVEESKDQLVAQAEAKAAQLIETARAEADKLVEKATNPIAKIAAKAAADKLISEAEKKAQQIIDEAKK